MAIAIRVQPVAGGVTRCAWCHTVATQGRVCPDCNTRLHTDCAVQAGTCPTLGCSKRLAPGASPVRPRRRWVRQALAQRAERERDEAWRRPAEVRPLTGSETMWTLFLGIAVPVLCVLADPIVFRGSHAVAPGLAPVAYVLIATQIALLPFGILGEWWDGVNDSFVGGALSVGALGAFAIGLGMLPITLLGLLLGIGALGFLPFFTARAYRRVARRCFARAGGADLGAALLGAAVALGPVLVVALLWG